MLPTAKRFLDLTAQELGDEVRLGDTTLRVWIIDPPAAEEPYDSEKSSPWATECAAGLCAVGC